MELVTKWYRLKCGVLKTMVLCGNPEDEDGLDDLWMPFCYNIAAINGYKMASPKEEADTTAGLTTIYGQESHYYVIDIPYEEFDNLYFAWKESLEV